MSLQTHVAHELLDPPSRVSPPLPAQFRVDAGRAIDPPLGGKDPADVPAQLSFRLRAVQHLLDSGKALSDVAGELGVSPGQLSQCRNEQLAAGSAEALAARKAEQAETQRLRREVKRLEEEVEILRKAAAFFARGIA